MDQQDGGIALAGPERANQDAPRVQPFGAVTGAEWGMVEQKQQSGQQRERDPPAGEVPSQRTGH